MIRKVENERSAESVEIFQGTLFTVRSFGKETERVDVITNIGKDTYFYAAHIKKGEDGVYFGLGGTGGPENFGRVVGRMSPEEVIEAARLGARKLGYELSKTQVDYFQTSARQGSRILLLDR